MSESAANYSIDPQLTLKKLEGIKVDFPDQPTEVTFLLSSHANESDLAPFARDLMLGSDIVLVEAALWTEEGQSILTGMADGDPEMQARLTLALEENAQDTSFNSALYQAMYGIKKPVRACDIPRTRRNVELTQMPTPSGKSLSTAEGLMSQMRKALHWELANRTYVRDKHILRTIYPTIVELFEPRPDPIKALFIIGSLHRSLPHILRTQIAARELQDTHSIEEIYYGDCDHVLVDLYIDFLQGRTFSDEEMLRAKLTALIGKYDSEGLAVKDYSLEQLTAGISQLTGGIALGDAL